MISVANNSQVKESLENTLLTAKKLDVPLWSILETLSGMLFSSRDFIDAGVVAQASITCKANAIVCEKARQLSANRYEINH